MRPFHAVILGFIQGLTEFLPVSSSGHLVITQTLLNFATPPIFFDVTVHVATLASVFIFFRREILSLKPKLLKLIIIATIPTGIIGLILNPFKAALFSSLNIVSAGLLVTSALLLISFFMKPKSKITALPSASQALLIGIAQGLAIIPGISRSGATLSIALLLGLSSKTSFTFSFLISIPAIIAALLLLLVQDPTLLQVSPASTSLGFIAALLTGLAALKLLRVIIKNSRLYVFAIYTTILATVTLLL